MNILIFSRNSHYNESPAGGAEASLRLNAEKFSSIGENVIYVTQARSKTPSIGHNKSIFAKRWYNPNTYPFKTVFFISRI